MIIENEQCDLRMLSLLHALGDKDEIIREATRLLTEPDLNEVSWCQVQDMGRDVAPDHPLFRFGRTIGQLRKDHTELTHDQSRRSSSDQRQADRRVAQRRAVPSRRSLDRRVTTLAWIGAERRTHNRRHGN